jgi:thiol peroxidase
MATVTLKGNPIHTSGELPPAGSTAPDFRLTAKDLSDVTLQNFTGKRKLLNIVPSLDTGVCAASARRFNQEAAAVPGAAVLTVSRDLPFAQARFCAAEGIENVVTLSELRDLSFGEAYGVRIVGPSRASSPGPSSSSTNRTASSTPSWCPRSPRNRTTPRPSPPCGGRGRAGENPEGSRTPGERRWFWP